ncbi:MAG TPA: MFS transporter [Candidatus Peregrinibacteria bacterium]|nr:MFS transporter [Candidatus Peregrinibacteria bacterium]
MLKELVEDHKNIPHSASLACFTFAIFTFGLGFAEPYLPIFLKNLGGNLILVGFFVALGAIASLFLTSPVEILRRRVDSRKLLIVGKLFYVLGGIFLFLAGYLKSIPVLTIGIILLGLGYPLVWLLTEAYLRESSSLRHSSPISSLFMFSWFFAWLLGALFSSELVRSFPIHYLFLIISIFSLISLLFDLQLTKTSKKASPEKALISDDHFYGKMLQEMKKDDPRLPYVVTLKFFWEVIFWIALIFIPIFAFQYFALYQVAFVVCATFLPFLFSPFLRKFTQKIDRFEVIVFGFIILAVTLGLFAFIGDPRWIYILGLTLSLFLAATKPVIADFITTLTPEKRRKDILGLTFLIKRLGMILGVIVFGLIAEYFGIPRAMFVFGIITLVLGLGSIGLKEKYRKNLKTINQSKHHFRFHPHFGD